MSYKPSWENGGWKVICDVCGRLFKEDDLQRRWDGVMVCSSDWEPRQPQDFVRGVADKQAPPWARPEASDSFIFVCTSLTNQGIADYGVSDCARADIDNGIRPVCSLEGSSCIASFAISGCSIAAQPFPGELVTIPGSPTVPSLNGFVCTVGGSSCLAGNGWAGCSTVGRIYL